MNEFKAYIKHRYFYWHLHKCLLS